MLVYEINIFQIFRFCERQKLQRDKENNGLGNNRCNWKYPDEHKVEIGRQVSLFSCRTIAGASVDYLLSLVRLLYPADLHRCVAAAAAAAAAAVLKQPNSARSRNGARWRVADIFHHFLPPVAVSAPLSTRCAWRPAVVQVRAIWHWLIDCHVHQNDGQKSPLLRADSTCGERTQIIHNDNPKSLVPKVISFIWSCGIKIIIIIEYWNISFTRIDSQ